VGCLAKKKEKSFIFISKKSKKSMESLVFPQKGMGTKLTVKFPDVPVVRVVFDKSSTIWRSESEY